jgi:putative oxidoreductase
VQKVFGVLGGRMPPVGTLHWTGGYLELIGGALLMLGLFTRPTAFVLSGMMAVAYFMAHASAGFLPIVNRGELAVLYCFVFLYLAAAGAGPWSVDALMKKAPAKKAAASHR